MQVISLRLHYYRSQGNQYDSKYEKELATNTRNNPQFCWKSVWNRLKCLYTDPETAQNMDKQLPIVSFLIGPFCKKSFMRDKTVVNIRNHQVSNEIPGCCLSIGISQTSCCQAFWVQWLTEVIWFWPFLNCILMMTENLPYFKHL